jgi:hypothetical protein
MSSREFAADSDYNNILTKNMNMILKKSAAQLRVAQYLYIRMGMRPICIYAQMADQQREEALKTDILAST